jgi:hypothetical protein
VLAIDNAHTCIKNQQGNVGGGGIDIFFLERHMNVGDGVAIVFLAKHTKHKQWHLRGTQRQIFRDGTSWAS